MNNVGVVAIGPPHEIPIEEWVRVIDIDRSSLPTDSRPVSINIDE